VLRSLVESAEVFSNLYDRKHGDDKEFVNRVFPPGASDEPNATSIEELMFSIQAVLNLYYPTEDLSHPEIRELGYYKQREWKIIPQLRDQQPLDLSQSEGLSRRPSGTSQIESGIL